jgi:hypothetical protein
MIPEPTPAQKLGPEEELPVLKQTFVLDRYTGEESPKLIPIPMVKKVDNQLWELQFHLELNGGAVIGIASSDESSTLADVISLEKCGISFKINTGSQKPVNVQQNWAFMPLDDAGYNQWLEATGTTTPQ